MSKWIDTYIVYTVVKRLSLPFTKWKAFNLGVIDANGEILIEPKKRTSEQDKSFTLLDTMLLNLKKILMKVPGNKSSFLTFAAAMFLLKENREPSEEEIKIMNENLLTEDAPVNNVGGGNIAMPNGPTTTFSGHAVFDVDSDSVWKSRLGKKPYLKYSKYINLPEVNEKVREYAKKNPRKSILLRNSKTGEMIFLRRSLKESYDRLYEDYNVSKNDIAKLEQYLDALFKTLGLGVDFSEHFHERLNDKRNIQPISLKELIEIYKETYKKYGKVFSKFEPETEAVLKSIETDINLPFVMKKTNTGILDLRAKTVLRKKDFHTPDKIYPVK